MSAANLTRDDLSLSDKHRNELIASAISSDVAKERGYRTVEKKVDVTKVGFRTSQANVPGWLAPIYNVAGELDDYTFKPDQPRIKDGKAVKYEQPAKHAPSLDVPLRARKWVMDPAQPLVITEGVKKADAGVSHDLACISIAGVWNWKSHDVVAAFDQIPLKERAVYLGFDSDWRRKPSVQQAMERLAPVLRQRRANVYALDLPESTPGIKVGLDDYFANGGDAVKLFHHAVELADPGAAASAVKVTEVTLVTHAPGEEDGAIDGAQLLDDLCAFLAQFVSYPSHHALIAHVLWIAHAHLMDQWESTPRLAFLSPEPASGKTRTLEVTELLVPNPVEAVNVSAAYLFRRVAGDAGPPTILFDEVDTVFGPKAKEHEDVRGLLNAGHRRGAVAGRCVPRGKEIVTVDFPAYCAVALAGLGDLPDTILTRSVIIRMRRRAPSEQITPYRRRVYLEQGHALRDRLAFWASSIGAAVTDVWPPMPAGIEDRDADVWEASLAVADAAGGAWPVRARSAAIALVSESRKSTPSLGVRLLADIRAVFGEADKLFTQTLLDGLVALDEAPWAEIIAGKPMNPRGLAKRLKPYNIESTTIAIGTRRAKGYRREDFADALARYLSELPPEDPDPEPSPEKSVTSVTDDKKPVQSRLANAESATDALTDVTNVTANVTDTDGDPRHEVTQVTHVTHFSEDGELDANSDNSRAPDGGEQPECDNRNDELLTCVSLEVSNSANGVRRCLGCDEPLPAGERFFCNPSCRKLYRRAHSAASDSCQTGFDWPGADPDPTVNDPDPSETSNGEVYASRDSPPTSENVDSLTTPNRNEEDLGDELARRRKVVTTLRRHGWNGGDIALAADGAYVDPKTEVEIDPAWVESDFAKLASDAEGARR